MTKFLAKHDENTTSEENGSQENTNRDIHALQPSGSNPCREGKDEHETAYVPNEGYADHGVANDLGHMLAEKVN